MAICEMCGKKSQLFKTEVENVILQVCSLCSKHGKIIKKIKTIETIKKEKQIQSNKTKPEEFVIANYGKIIKKKREKLEKTQKEFAQFLNEKESIIQKIETGSFEPPLKMAKRFEKILKIKLIETMEINSEEKQSQNKSGSLTIGDIIKIKK